MTHLTSFLIGALFSVGLAISGMIQPVKIQRFLDVTGDWDPTLAFVMGGALAVYLPAYRWVMRRQRPWLASRFEVPTRNDISWQLVTGSVLFGAGWGITGFCPAAAFTALPALSSNAVVVIVGMAVGMVGMRTLRNALAPRLPATASDA